MELLDRYFELQEEIYAYFGYVEDWRVIPLDDSRKYFWRLNGTGPGEVQYADTEEALATETDNYYADTIYTQRHLPKRVYRGEHYTMICCDPAVDGNKFLRIFSNDKERPRTA